MNTQIQFLGAAQTVTGSKFLIEHGGKRVLVECGLFQGKKEYRQRNWNPMPVDPSSVDAVLLTHAHLDHSGYLPKLAKGGFNGPIYGTAATKELLGLILPDSGHLQEEEAEYANKKGFSKHKPALPLYTKQDAVDSLAQVEPVPYGKPFAVADGINATLHPSGHILGAAFVELAMNGTRVVISGDVGGYDGIVMRPPVDLPADADYILVESTYGGRTDDHRPVQDQLRERIAPVLANGGVVVIPAFAIGRTTLVLYHLRALQERGALPDVPVFVDSPMATDAVNLYCKYAGEHNLRSDELQNPSLCSIRTRNTTLVKDVEASKLLNRQKGPMIIISSSGMATGGRVVHHLKNRIGDERNLILLVGYQAIGTRGRMLLDGVPYLKMHGEVYPIKAKVASIKGLSAHGDSDEILRWLGTAKRPPKTLFLVHGEEDGLEAMRARVRDELRWSSHAPQYLEKTEL